MEPFFLQSPSNAEIIEMRKARATTKKLAKSPVKKLPQQEECFCYWCVLATTKSNEDIILHNQTLKV